jgi:P27 family predicted phage terminase small subunit
MAIRGPKPTPENFKVLMGRSHHKKKETVQVSPLDKSQIPKELLDSLPKDVRLRAQATLAILLDKKILGACDIETFTRYCQHLRIGYEANEILKRDGLVNEDVHGVVHKHPAFQMHRDSSLAALRYEEQFGLTPSARMRLTKTDDQVKEDDYAQFRRADKTG